MDLYPEYLRRIQYTNTTPPPDEGRWWHITIALRQSISHLFTERDDLVRRMEQLERKIGFLEEENYRLKQEVQATDRYVRINLEELK